MSGTHRLFYALWPDAATAQALARRQAGLGGRLTLEDDLHMTLAFLGDQADETLPVLRDVLHAQTLPEMAFVLDRFGYFSRLRLVWAGMAQIPPALESLRRSLVSSLLQHGVEFRPETVFRPHITLARKTSFPDDQRFDPISWNRWRFVLARSCGLRTLPNGRKARYEILYSR